MICKRWWMALGLAAAMVGCEPGGGPSTPAPAASKAVPTSGNSGDQAVPATDVSKGEAPMPTGGLSPTGTDATESKGAGAAKGKAAAAGVTPLRCGNRRDQEAAGRRPGGRAGPEGLPDHRQSSRRPRDGHPDQGGG